MNEQRDAVHIKSVHIYLAFSSREHDGRTLWWWGACVTRKRTFRRAWRRLHRPIVAMVPRCALFSVIHHRQSAS